MASRITIYGAPSDVDVKRLRREMRVMYVESDTANPETDEKARKRLQEWCEPGFRLPVVEVRLADESASVFLSNPDEPTLRQSLYSEGILSTTAYWV